MREKGLPIVDFSHSVKSRESLITKLLAKKENVAAQVYDKTRFRIVTPTRADILPVALLPHPAAVPVQLRGAGADRELAASVQVAPARVSRTSGSTRTSCTSTRTSRTARAPRGNEFSGSGYKALNFVVDVPIRLDE